MSCVWITLAGASENENDPGPARTALGQVSERCGRQRERGECGMLVTFSAKEDAGFQRHDTVCHYELYAINLTVLVCAEGASTALHV